jgi:DNA primase catalytic core
MARIPDEEIERLKRETDLAELVRRRGVRLERHGKDLIGLCPFHDDHEPSLVVTPSKNLWHCLGACQAGGSVVDWVMKSEGVSVRHALELLRAGTLSVGPIAPVKFSTVPKLPSPVDVSADDAAMLRDVAAYYHETLKASPAALRYLETRGIADPEAIERFQLGYADRSLGLRLPDKNRVGGAELRSRLQTLGLLRESGHEHFNGCVVFPVINQGEVLGMYGRKINDNLRVGTAFHLYLPGPHRGIWNLEAFATSKELIFCESVIDALSFWCAGLRNVTCAYGINGFTDAMLEAMKAYGIARVLLAYDADEAGDAAARALAARLIAEGIGAARVHFPRGMDANAYARKVTPAAQSLGIAVRSAAWLGGPTRAPETQGEPDEPVEAGPAFSLAAPVPAAEPDITALVPEREPLAPAGAPSDPAQPVEIVLGDRQYRVRGLEKNLSYEQMRVVVRVACGTSDFIDSLDLVSARQRLAYVKQAAAELGLKEEILRNDLAKVRGRLEPLQESLIKAALAPQKTPVVTVSPDDEREALALLRAPDLVERIVRDFDRCGFVGERTNKLMAYLAAVSRKLDEPLAIIIQSSSAAGKTALMDAVLALVPEEERVRYSAMTGRSLFYMQGTDLKHKILAISEEEGAEQASYALKLLQSEGELTIASTGKDPHTGKLVTEEYHVEGPVMIIVTTTKVEIDEELLNRCIVLTVDETQEQTRAIHALQRAAQTLEGLLSKRESVEVIRLHRNAQRLLRPLLVANPYARHLTFLDGRTRTRRDHMKYLTLIRTIALLHQYQRPKKTAAHNGDAVEYIEVARDDIRLANELANEVLGRSLDELPPQTRRLLALLDALVTSECERLAIDRCDYRFTQRQVRELAGWSDFQVKTHLRKLTEMEYVLIHRGGRGQSFVYELLYHGEGHDGRPFLMGLADAASLPDSPHAYDEKREHRNPEWEHRNIGWEHPGSGQGAPGEHGGSGGRSATIANDDGTTLSLAASGAEKSYPGGNGKDTSYPHLAAVAVAKPRRPRP